MEIEGKSVEMVKGGKEVGKVQCKIEQRWIRRNRKRGNGRKMCGNGERR